MTKNDIELEVIFNGKPDLKLIPKEIMRTMLGALEQQIVEWVQKEKNTK